MATSPKFTNFIWVRHHFQATFTLPCAIVIHWASAQSPACTLRPVQKESRSRQAQGTSGEEPWAYLRMSRDSPVPLPCPYRIERKSGHPSGRVDVVDQRDSQPDVARLFVPARWLLPSVGRLRLLSRCSPVRPFSLLRIPHQEKILDSRRVFWFQEQSSVPLEPSGCRLALGGRHPAVSSLGANSSVL
jgi:hypothetical protein